jgi:hypothetical protein
MMTRGSPGSPPVVLSAYAEIAVQLAEKDRKNSAMCRWQGRLAKAIPWCVWLYVASLTAVWLLLVLGGDPHHLAGKRGPPFLRKIQLEQLAQSPKRATVSYLRNEISVG